MAITTQERSPELNRLRKEIEKFLDDISMIIIAGQAFISRELTILEQLTSMKAFDRAKLVGDHALLDRLSSKRQSLMESCWLITRRPPPLLQARVDFASLMAKTEFQVVVKQVERKQEKVCKVCEKLKKFGGPRNDKELAQYVGAYRESLHATNRAYTMHDKVLLGPVRKFYYSLGDPPPKPGRNWTFDKVADWAIDQKKGPPKLTIKELFQLAKGKFEDDQVPPTFDKFKEAMRRRTRYRKKEA